MEKLYDSELKVMEPLWADGPLSAGALAKRLGASCGWNRNTTYTVIKKLIDKGAVARSDPGFVCTPLITRREVQRRRRTASSPGCSAAPKPSSSPPSSPKRISPRPRQPSSGP